MLEIFVPSLELFDDEKQEFVYIGKDQHLQLEHSLVSLSKWESKWHIAFLGKKEKTNEHVIDYVRCMTITQNVKPEIYLNLTADALKKIKDYIDEPMTATWFNEQKSASVLGKKVDTATAELIYYWMISLNIPMECQKWHLNRLIALIRVCGLKNNPPKKTGRKEMLAQRRALNASRRQELNSRG